MIWKQGVCWELMKHRRVREQDTKSRKWQELHTERLEKLEKMVFAQHEKLDNLESLMYRFMHRNRVGLEDGLESANDSPDHQDETHSDLGRQPPPSELPAAGQGNGEHRVLRPDRTKPYYSISSV
jgi:hypothetical protein